MCAIKETLWIELNDRAEFYDQRFKNSSVFVVGMYVRHYLWVNAVVYALVLAAYIADFCFWRKQVSVVVACT